MIRAQLNYNSVRSSPYCMGGRSFSGGNFHFSFGTDTTLLALLWSLILRNSMNFTGKNTFLNGIPEGQTSVHRSHVPQQQSCMNRRLASSSRPFSIASFIRTGYSPNGQASIHREHLMQLVSLFFTSSSPVCQFDSLWRWLFKFSNSRTI